MSEYLTDDDLRALRDLRSRGFAVVVWTPAEIGEADGGHLENIVIERGNEALEQWNQGEDEEE